MNSTTTDIQGYLYKKGNKSLLSSSSAWKKRWFNLSSGSNSLKYFKNQNDEIPKGSIIIQSIESIEILTTNTTNTNTTSNTSLNNSNGSSGSGNGNNNKFYFDIKTKSRIYHLFSETEQDRDYWNINLNISIVKFNDTINDNNNNNNNHVRPRSNTSPSPQPTLVVAQPTTTTTTPPTNKPTSNGNVTNKPPLPPKPETQQQQQQSPSSLKNSNNNNNVILNNKQTTTNNVQHHHQQQQQQQQHHQQQHHHHQKYEFEDDDISMCGAKIRDYVKNHSSGYITSMVAVTRSKIWCADSQGNIITYTISRNGSGGPTTTSNNTPPTSTSPTDKLKKGSQWKEHNQMVTSLVYVPSQKLVYSSSLDGKICAWNKTDYSLVFTHTSKFPIYDMLYSKNDLLVYCGGISSSSSPISQLTNKDNNNSSQQQKQFSNTLSLFDTITKEETEVPFSSYLPNNFNNTSSHKNHNSSSGGNIKKRKFIKMIKYDEKIIICTDKSEIIVWSPWENEVCKFITLANSFDITAIGVVGDGKLWVCSTQDSSNNLFSATMPCMINILDLNTSNTGSNGGQLKRIKSFECQHPISQFNVVNGYVWAVSRSFISIYEPETAQLPFECIQLKEDMNFRILYNQNMVWIGGTWLFRFQIFDNWIRDNLEHHHHTHHRSPDTKQSTSASIETMIINIQPISDYYDYEHIEMILKLINNRLSIEHSNQLYDILLTIGENELLLSDFQILVVKSLRNFCKNQTTIVMREFILNDNNRIYRISKLLSSYLISNKSLNNNQILIIIETLKTINYLISNFDKFTKQFQQSSSSSSIIETIIKFTILSFSNFKIIISISLIILNRLLLSSNNSNNNNNGDLLNSNNNNVSSNGNTLYNNLKEKIKIYLSIFFESTIDDKTRIAIINIVSRYPNELKEQFKKESNILQVYEILNQGTSLCCNDLIIIINQILKDSPKIKDLILKVSPNLLKLIEQQPTGTGSISNGSSSSNDKIRVYQLMSNPTFIQKSFSGGNKNLKNGGVGNNGRKLIISSNFQSPVESILFTLNSILHSLKSTSFSNVKITILDIILPKEFPIDFLNSTSSLVNINFILPTNSFISTIKFKFQPKDLAIKIAFERGLSIGETTISNFSITGDLQLGFAIGTAKPEWISFLDEPDIKFQIDSSGLILNVVDLFVKSIVKKKIKKKLVHPNRFYLPNM